MGHPSVELPLQEESYDEPVDGDHAVGWTFQKEKSKSSYDCDGGLETEVKIFEEVENKS